MTQTRERTKVTIRSYGDYSSDNYGAHSLEVRVGDLVLYFSYQTVIAFCTPGTGRRVCENVWSTTTGKHLSWIDGGNKKNRLPSAQFDNELEEVLQHYNLIT